MKYEDTLKEIADEQAAKAGLESTETEETVEETQSEESKPKELLITDEMVEQFGFPKEMAGKPISEMANSYRNLHKDYTKKSQRLSELEKLEMSQAETKEEKQEVKEAHKKMPDPVDDPDGFEKWMAEREAVLEQRAYEKLKKEFQPIEDEVRTQQERAFLNGLKKELPEGLDPQEAIQEWVAESGLIQDDDDKLYYMKKPLRLHQEVVKYWENKSAKKSKQAKAKSEGDKNLKKIAQTLEYTSRERASEDNSVDRFEEKPSGRHGEIFKEIADEAAARLGI